MSKRDDDVPRRLRWAGLLAAVLVLGTGTAAAQAYWKAQVQLGGTVSAGAFSLTTTWGNDWQKWTPAFPGEPRSSALLTVKESGAAGSTLRWRLSARPSFSAEFAPYVRTTVFVGRCDGPTTIPSGAYYSPPGGFAPGDTVTLCLQIMLTADAPTDLQGRPLVPALELTAEQVVS